MLLLKLTPEEFRFLLSLLEEEEMERRAAEYPTGFPFDSLREKANNTYHDWEKEKL